MHIDAVFIFCEVDDFVKQHQQQWNQKLIQDSIKKRNRATSLSLSEMTTIIILFHSCGYRTFKQFYLALPLLYPGYFPKLLSYNRFIELMPKTILVLCSFLETRKGQCTGISFIDSTPIQVCKPKRMIVNKVFKGFAKKGKSTIGWFFGFKLHLVVNDQGELLSIKLTAANVDDRKPVPSLTKGLFGKLFGDKGYISKSLFNILFQNGISLYSGTRKNMKEKLISLLDKVLHRKRSIIETINDQLKNISQIEHSRHRSITGFIVNLLGALIAYTFQSKKPSIKHVFLEDSELNLVPA